MIIYTITNLLNGKKYVGMTEQRPQKRWSQHKWDARTSNTAIGRAIRAHGVKNFVFEHVFSLLPGCSRQDLCEMERSFIQQEGVYGRGYNMTPGGDGLPKGSPGTWLGKNLSEEHRAKLRAAWARNPERKAAQTERCKGKPMSEAQKQKLRAVYDDPEAREKNAEHLRRLAQTVCKTPQQSQKIRDSWTPERRARQSLMTAQQMAERKRREQSDLTQVEQRAA